MEVDEALQAEIIAATAPVIAGAAGLVALLVLDDELELVATNYESSDLTGTKIIRPTQDETIASSSETAASSTEGKLSKDEVNAQSGAVKADDTDAAAASSEATALEDGATAVRTKAGASDIETKLLKMT